MAPTNDYGITPILRADFHNADSAGRLRLNTVGVVHSHLLSGVRLEEGLLLVVRDEDLEADAVAHFSPDERLWVARIDWNAIRTVAI